MEYTGLKIIVRKMKHRMENKVNFKHKNDPMGPYKLCYYSCCPTTSQMSLVLTCGNDYTAHPFREEGWTGRGLVFQYWQQAVFSEDNKKVKELTELCLPMSAFIADG